mmetsp:Transcript_27158/g.65925  ORF Transcript_27158/g.65925 Transcript_27158/m.65925 type:complete len:89 (-) Transcript_27158:689-955(-)
MFTFILGSDATLRKGPRQAQAHPVVSLSLPWWLTFRGKKKNSQTSNEFPLAFLPPFTIADRYNPSVSEQIRFQSPVFIGSPFFSNDLN